MFDLVDILNKSSVDDQPDVQVKGVLFYKTKVCKSLVTEAFAFEGIGSPALLENEDSKIAEYVDTHEVELVLLELTNSDSVVSDAERIRHILPNQASVIVIGNEDAISTIRQLKAMGFYYLFWPISKQELSDFVKSVHDARVSQKGLGKNRRGKRISVVGVKGGVGCSMISSEIAYVLTEKLRANALLVDHHYSGGNLDIMLGKKDIKKRYLQEGMFINTLDHNSAQTLLDKVSDKIRLLSIGADPGKHSEVREFTDSVLELVCHDVNFIVEDISASINFEVTPKWLCDRSDIIVIVSEPTVSSLRDAERLMKSLALERQEASHPIRQILIVNRHRASKFDSVSNQDIERYLECRIDVVLPYDAKTSDLILRGKRLFNSRTKMAAPIQQLLSQLVGESNNNRRGMFGFLRRK